MQPRTQKHTTSSFVLSHAMTAAGVDGPNLTVLQHKTEQRGQIVWVKRVTHPIAARSVYYSIVASDRSVANLRRASVALSKSET